MFSRRLFLQRTAALTGGSFLSSEGVSFAAMNTGRSLHLACNQYVWHVFYQREGKNLAERLDPALGEMKEAGIDGFEPTLGSAEEVDALRPRLERHGLEMRSFYVNSTLHEPDQVSQSLDQILAIANAAKRAGVRIVVTNPSPLRWGGPENKNDRQLECQAEAMNRLGKALKDLGLKLAYHNHDIELREAGREFHHMMVGTDPECVGLCLDAHWIYRGSGNSSVALFDVARLYARRVCELHLRQSRDHVWTESLGDGDIDYPRLVKVLASESMHPHLVLEQAVEDRTPHTMDAVAAHRETVAYARRVFAPLG
jgi:inosose dehydratase